MFSGLTNQVSSWMGGTGKKEGEVAKSDEEKLQSPNTDAAEVGLNDAEKKDASPTKASSKLEMLSNVKSQVTGLTGWLSSGVSGLRKTEPTATENSDAAGDGKVETESPASEKSVKGSPVEEKEDDNSSATGGADSDAPVSEPGTPGEDKEGGAGFAGAAVSTKAFQGAKSIGNFLYSAVNKAGKTVSEASAKIKKTVEENSLLGEFNKEQDAFIKEKQGKNSDAAVPPWVGCPNEEALKEEFLSLSTDRRNFVRSPPAGVEFEFDYEVSYPVAMATLAEDPNLEKMRFELVPKVIKEEEFWRNYFYRVSLIRQANELSSMAQESTPSSRINSTEGEPAAKPRHEEVFVNANTEADSPTHEFVSDTFRASSTDLEEVREGMRKLGMDPDKRDEEEWERELEAELQDYEVVTDGNNSTQDRSLENQIQEMLDSEDMTDLK